MARIRSIKPEFFTSEAIASLPLSARLTFIGLWTYVDDNGVGLDNEMLITAAIWPLEDDHAGTLARTQGDLKILADAELISRYESSRSPRESLARASRKTPQNGKPPSRKRLLHVTSWAEHQKVDHPRLPRYPPPAEATDYEPPACTDAGEAEDVAKSSREPRETVAPEQGSGIRDQGSGISDGGASAAGEDKSKTRRGTRIPADFGITPEMGEWGRERCPNVNGRVETEKFVNYWTSKSGKDACKLDWLATWKNWMLTAEERAPHPVAASTARPSTTDQRVAQAQALKAQMRAGNGTEPAPAPPNTIPGSVVR